MDYSQKPIKRHYSDRVPIRLVFKNEKMAKLAGQRLKTHLVVALKHLTVSEFLAEVLEAMNITRIHSGYELIVRFRGWTNPAPIMFTDRTVLDRVHAKICSIEEGRVSPKSADAYVMQAEFDLLKT